MIINIERVGIARHDRKRRSIARIKRRNFVAVTVQLLDEQHEVRDRTAAGQIAGSEFRDQLVKLALGEMRVPRDDHQLVQ